MIENLKSILISSVTLVASASALSAQLVINEVWENPPNGGDQTYEYIELYGPPNYSLTGYLVALVKGDGEIDEAFSLDGFFTDPEGLFLLYNTAPNGTSGLAQYDSVETNTVVPFSGGGNGTFDPIAPLSVNNQPLKGGAPFQVAHAPSPFDTAGKLENDNSSTYLLVRRRPGYAISQTGDGLYSAGYAWWKDVNADVNSDSFLDFGFEPSIPIQSPPAGMFEPVQIVDEISWSNNALREYHTPGRGRRQNEISETPGFNPDAVSRIRYLNANPMTGGYTADQSEEPRITTNADESWIYGEQINITPGLSDYGLYKDFFEGEDRTFGAPTDPSGNFYSYTGSNQNPLFFPFFESTDSLDQANGTQLFEPYQISGFRMTPGGFNDAPLGSALIGTDIERQFRWEQFRGDFDFDGDVDCDDRALIQSAADHGWTLDDVSLFTQDFDNDDPQDDHTYERFSRQLENFNAILMMIRMDSADGSTGEWDSGQVLQGNMVVSWGGAVTEFDLVAFDQAFPGICVLLLPVDADSSGVVDWFDLAIALDLADSDSASVDYDQSGQVDRIDVEAFLELLGN